MPMVGRHLLVFDPEMSTTSLPTEIYPKFFENLDHFDDGNTLLSIAQCSRLFCIESLRVFFSIAFLEYWGRSKPPSSVILTRHEALLEAILRAPNHLGPLVRSYNQYNISCHANAAGKRHHCILHRIIMNLDVAITARVSTDKTTPDAGSWPGQQIHVFNLTAQALHHMPNLKEFRFMPAGTHECSELLSRVPRYVYPFQLKTLDWRYGDTAYEKDFLSTQSSLRCLDVFSWRFRADDVLRNCISPVLESMSGSLGELCVVAAGRDIVALEYIEWADGDDEFLMQLPGAMQPSDAIARIKYLRLHGGGNLETYLTLASKAGHASQEYHIMLLVIGELEREVRHLPLAMSLPGDLDGCFLIRTYLSTTSYHLVSKCSFFRTGETQIRILMRKAGETLRAQCSLCYPSSDISLYASTCAGSPFMHGECPRTRL